MKLETNATTASANATLHFANTAGTANDMIIATDGVPYGTTVASFTGTTIVMSAAATATVASGQLVLLSTASPQFVIGETVTGGTSGDSGVVARVQETSVNLRDYTGDFTVTETLTGSAGGAATLLLATEEQQLDTVYQHEFGVDKVLDAEVTAIPSSITSADFGLAVGGPFARVPKVLNKMTRLPRIEPDFGATGALTVTVEGRDFAAEEMTPLATIPVAPGTPFIEPRVQARMLRLTVSSNVAGGTYQFGQPLVHLEPGDERSKVET